MLKTLKSPNVFFSGSSRTMLLYIRHRNRLSCQPLGAEPGFQLNTTGFQPSFKDFIPGIAQEPRRTASSEQ
jgi:hypothetical protein